jgi:peptide/nickel transport system permease protein
MSNPNNRSIWSPLMVLGTLMMALLVLVAILAPTVLSGPAETLTSNAGLGPSGEHWLGTDDFGRDLLARSLVATRLTLLMTVAATAIAVVLGLVLGLSIWLVGRKVREGALRLLETAVAYPGIIVALVIAAILQPGVNSTILAIGLSGIPGFARITANLAAGIANSEFVVTAKLLGVSRLRIALRHMLPNMAEPVLVLSATLFSLTLVEISALSFIGLGVQSPDFDFGRLLNDSLNALYTQPVQALGPSVMIVLTGLAAMLIGDALAAHANPRSSRRPARRVLQTQRTVEVPADDKSLVRVENLRIAIPGGSELVKGVSLDIRPGEVLGLVGESGSGKSLTAMSIAGLPAEELNVTADLLRIGELNMLARPDRARLAKDIGIIYQDPGSTFNPALRMGSQLTEVLRSHFGLSRAKARAAMARALEKVNITNPQQRLNQHPHELSGGMRQRAMIASAMVTEPKLLVADEPTTALDVTVQADVLRQFRRIHRENDTAILFISHDLGVVEALCDRILVMKDGEIVERLTREQLTSRDVEHPYTRKLLDAVPEIQPVRPSKQKETV